MNEIKIDFEDRVKEIRSYFKFVEIISDMNSKILLSNNSGMESFSINDDVRKMLKANIFILLYNLVESSFKKSLDKIYDQVTQERISYKDTIDIVKKMWLKEHYNSFSNLDSLMSKQNAYKKPLDFLLYSIENIANDCIALTGTSVSISGNVDGRKIKEILENHGIDVRKLSTLNCDKIYMVKNNRNSLAHGDEKFSECGRRYTIGELNDIVDQTIDFMRKTLNHISKSLDKKYYKVS